MYSIDWARLLSRSPSGPAQSRDASSRSASARPRIHRIVWYLGITSFFTDVSSEMVSSILPIYLVLYLRLSPVAFGAIDGLYQGFAAIARLAGGYVADRWRNHKAVAAFGYALSAACRVGLLAAGNAWGLLAATIAIDRTGKGIRTAPRDTMISLNTERENLASAFGVHRALDAAGATLGPLIAFLLFSFMSNAFDAIFVVSFCVAVIGVGVIVFFVDNSKHTTTEAPHVSLTGTMGLLRIPAFRNLCLAGTALSLATVSDSFIFLTLQRTVAFGAQYFPLLYVGVAAFNSMFAVPMGRLADRYGRWRTFIVGHVVLCLVYLTVIAPFAGMPSLLVALLLSGVYYAATDGVLAASASAALPAHLTGSGLALIATLTNMARLLGSILFGAAWQWLGLTNAVLLFAGGLVVAVMMAAIVRPRGIIWPPIARLEES
jgi:MFS family permease